MASLLLHLVLSVVAVIDLTSSESTSSCGVVQHETNTSSSSCAQSLKQVTSVNSQLMMVNAQLMTANCQLTSAVSQLQQDVAQLKSGQDLQQLKSMISQLVNSTSRRGVDELKDKEDNQRMTMIIKLVNSTSQLQEDVAELKSGQELLHLKTMNSELINATYGYRKMLMS